MKKFAKRLIALATIVALCIVMTAAALKISVTGISLPESLTLKEGQAAILDVGFTVDKEDATLDEIKEAASKLTLVWTSSDETVATVDEAGAVTGVNFGTATITVLADGKELSAATSVEVKPVLEAIEVPGLVELTFNGKTGQALGPVLTPADAPVELTYSSSDESVAIVDASGHVTAVGNGSCIIVTDTKYGIGGMTVVNVNTAPRELSMEDMTLTIGDSAAVNVIVEGENITTGLDFTYTSDDESVVSVSEDGTVRAVGVGSATITATNDIGGGSHQYAYCKVIVRDVVCSYCGQEGHVANNCPTKAADEAAAAQKAEEEAKAAEEAARQAAQTVELYEASTPLAAPSAPADTSGHGAFGEIPAGCGSGSMCPEL